MSMMSESSPWKTTVKQELFEHDEEVTSSLAADTVLNMVKQELGALKTEADCVITDLLVSETDGVAKYKIIPLSNASDNPSLQNDQISDNPHNDQYLCKACSFVSHTKRGLMVHKTLVHKSSRVQCTTCAKIVSKCQLKKHMQLHVAHDNDKIPCLECSFTGSRKELTKHRLEQSHVSEFHIGPLKRKPYRKYKCYKCLQCNQKFYSSRQFKNHEKRHNVRGEAEFICSHCNIFFDHAGMLEFHLSKCMTSSIKRDVACLHCKAKFFSKEYLRIHLRKTHRNLLSKDENLQIAYPCPVDSCGKHFLHKSTLNSHKRVHDPPNLCVHCNKAFRDLKSHIKYKHGTAVEPCPYCHKFYRNLKNHIRHIHTMNKSCRYRCQTCGKGFAWMCLFTIHRRRHTGVRPFPCTMCEYSAATKSALKFHMINTKHSAEQLSVSSEANPENSESGSDLFCRKCNVSCKTEIEYDLHLMSVNHKVKMDVTSSGSEPSKVKKERKKYECQSCHRLYLTKGGLKRHENTHSPVKLVCSKCNTLLATPESLDTHMRVMHPKEDAKICTICKGCNETFDNVKVLRKHMKYCVHL